MNKTVIAICIVIAVIVAYFIVGEYALGGLLALIGLQGGRKHEQNAKDAIDEADEHQAMADHHAGLSIRDIEQARKIEEQQKAISSKKNGKQDEDIEKVVRNAHKNWH